MLIAELPELGRMTSGEATQTRHRRHRAQAGHDVAPNFYPA
jgi:hypothetical protein